MQRSSYDFDVITGPSTPEPAAEPADTSEEPSKPERSKPERTDWGIAARIRSLA